MRMGFQHVQSFKLNQTLKMKTGVVDNTQFVLIRFTMQARN